MIYEHNMLWACKSGKSMNNLLSYCGLVDARIGASEKDLPVMYDISGQIFSLLMYDISGEIPKFHFFVGKPHNCSR